MEKAKISVKFNSNWEEGTVTTDAKLDLITGEVIDIETSNDGEDFECLLSETIDAGEVTATVEPDDDNRYFVSQVSLAAFRDWVATATLP